MKIQISRDSFDALKRYSGVYQQQGRMLTDADWNELMDVVKGHLGAALQDVIGSGTPQESGMAVVDSGAGPRLRAGRVYAEGLAGELRPDVTVAPTAADFPFDAQADFPAPPSLPAGEDYLLYLDLWERPVGYLEDGKLRDPGLYGADTCARSRTMAQVKWCPDGVDPEDAAQNPQRGDARLSLEVRAGSTLPDPCDPCADEMALQERVGNYLFRVEVHDVFESEGGRTRMVLKWSRENGAEQFAVGEEPPGFKGDDWVFEFFSGPQDTPPLASEAHLGVHLHSGAWMPVRGALAHGYPGSPPAGFSLVRRWDGAGTFERQADGSWSLVAGSEGSDRGISLSTASGADAPGHVVNGTTLAINLSALVLRLDLENRRPVAGDYWLAPVREALLQDAEGPLPPLLENVEPAGIRHHYLTLARVSGGTVTPVGGDSCRRLEFPPLTDLRAEDVCFDNSVCDLPDAGTVQEALDRLCRERDLRWHNRHLHGWGIVCGLQVECGPEIPVEEGEETERRRVRVQKGYAIDCEGNDVVLDQALLLDLLQRIGEHDQANSEAPLLDANGDGTVCLRLRLDDNGTPAVDVEAYQKEEGWEQLLDGTLLMDFYNDCIKGLVDALMKEVTPDTAAEETKVPVGPGRRRLIALLNLFIQLFNPTHGRYVFLSHAEHKILAAFHARLLELLRSKTFCAMFSDINFPDYPFEQSRLATFFGKGFHTRVRVHPGGKEVYTCAGTDDSIHIYHIEKQELRAVLQMPAGEGAEVQDIAFSADGRQLYAIALLKGTDTVFKVADAVGGGWKWRRATTVFCDLHMTTLHAPEKKRSLFAVGRGQGLFLIDPEKVLEETKPRPVPKYEFNAVGQLAVDERNNQAFATAAAGTALSESYDRVVRLDLQNLPADDQAPPSDTIQLTHPETGEDLSGEDDIAVAAGEVRRLYVIANPAQQSSRKHLLTYTGFTPSAVLDVEDTAIRLAYHDKADALLLTLEDSYRLQVVDPTGKKERLARHPVQISPISLAVNPETSDIFVLNFVSNTLSQIPADELMVTEEFLTKLSTYRTALLAAFFGLTAGLLQYLKDCFCHHLLLRCPSCDEQDKLYLGVVEVRGSEVYNICNFSKRRYVKSFPALSYWMSLVPVMPMLKKWLTSFCCSVLPPLFGKWFGQMAAPAQGQTTHRVKSQPMRHGVQTYKRTDFRSEWLGQKKTFGLGGRLAGDALTSRFETASVRDPGLKKSTLIDSDLQQTRQDLEKKGVIVEKVESYDRSVAGQELTAFARAPQRLAPGAKVTLVEKDGKVLYYKLAEEAEVKGVSPEVKAELEAFERRKASLRDMSGVQAELARVEARRAEFADLESLRTNLNSLDAEKTSVEKDLKSARQELAALKAERQALADVSGLRTQFDQMQSDLQKLQQSRETEAARLSELESRRATVETDLKEMQGALDNLARMRDELRVEIAGDRPVREIDGVNPEVDAQLREMGIRTVGELAAADPALLGRRGTGISATNAKNLIRDAQGRIKPR